MRLNIIDYDFDHRYLVHYNETKKSILQVFFQRISGSIATISRLTYKEAAQKRKKITRMSMPDLINVRSSIRLGALALSSW